MENKKLNFLDLDVGIYSTEATIIRHRNGSVTIKVPYIKWVNNDGNLAFESLFFDSGDERADTLSGEIFTENGCDEYPSLSEFLYYCCSDKWSKS